MSALLAIAASLAAIFGGVFAAFFWLFRLATKVAVLEQQMGEVQPVTIAKDIAWLKGAISAIARVIHADLSEQEP